MKTQEFIRRLRKLARRKDVEFLLDKSAGAGSHGRVWFDGPAFQRSSSTSAS
ncbi:MAG: hypothetical protein H6851_07305 [Geminicoccaceae bacterium]|nr:hypothetical protein [Geminicoccaceae bacterium]